MALVAGQPPSCVAPKILLSAAWLMHKFAPVVSQLLGNGLVELRQAPWIWLRPGDLAGSLRG